MSPGINKLKRFFKCFIQLGSKVILYYIIAFLSLIVPPLGLFLLTFTFAAHIAGTFYIMDDE